MKKSEIIIFGIVVLSFAIAIYSYSYMPAKVASHWNSSGTVDGYMSRFWGVFFMPILLTLLALLFVVIPRIDPLKENIAKFRKYFDNFVFLILAVFLFIYIDMLLWSIGIKINPAFVMPLAMGVLFFYVGVLLEKAKRNWFIGIRTPWTMSSEKVWDKTHKRAAILFKVAAILCLIGIFFKNYAIWFVLIPVIASAIYTFAYSYFEYQKLGSQKRQK